MKKQKTSKQKPGSKKPKATGVSRSKNARVQRETRNDKHPRTHWPVHPIALLYPPKTPEERAEMKADMKERVEHDLAPLDTPLLMYEDEILDGRHRDEIWMELAEEKACDGFFAKNRPPTETFSPEEHGTVQAWMRTKSRNILVRQTPKDQRAAIFLKAVEAHPELKAVLEDIKNEHVKRKQGGKPLAAGVQRSETVARVADLAGVGKTTMKQAQKLQKEAPEKLEEVAKGKKTAKTAIKEVAKEKGGKAATRQKTVKQSRPSFEPGDAIYQLEDFRQDVPGSPRLLKYTVDAIEKGILVCGSKRLQASNVMTVDAARAERQSRLKKWIAVLQGALKMQPPVVEK